MLTEQEVYEAALRRWQERYEQILDQVPVLLETLRDAVNPLKASRIDAERVSGGGRTAPLPLREAAVDDCDDVWAALVEYVAEVAERLHEPSPATGASWAASHGVRGIGAGVTGDDAYKAGFVIIAWLIDRAVRISALGLTDSEEHLFSLIRKLTARYVDAPPIERPAHRRWCGVCGEKAVTVAWLLGDVGEAECRVCGAVYAPEGKGEAT